MGIFEQVLKQSADWPAQANSSKDIEASFEKQLILRNTLQAIEQLGPKLGDADRTKLAEQLKQLESALPDQSLRLRAKEVRIGLEKTEAKAAA